MAQRYQNVSVLLLYWLENDDDNGFAHEARRLGNIFAGAFQFHVQYYPIPSGDSDSRLQSEITTLLDQYAQADTLVIIYYAGYTRPGNRNSKEIIWQA